MPLSALSDWTIRPTLRKIKPWRLWAGEIRAVIRKFRGRSLVILCHEPPAS
jgi:hypothetical protein